jgi:hypothetical protein
VDGPAEGIHPDRRVLFGRPARRLLGDGIVGVRPQLGFEGRVLGGPDGPWTSGPPACGERTGPFQADHILFDGREGYLEGARSLGLGHPSFHRPHDPLT